MQEYRLFVVTAEGPQLAAAPENVTSIHQLLLDRRVGVYTVLRTFEGIKFLLLERHLKRLEDSMTKLGWSYNFDKPSLRRALHEICTQYDGADSRIRIDVLAIPDSEEDSSERTFAAQGPFEPLDIDVYKKGVQVGTTNQLRRPNPLVKDANFVIKRERFLNRRAELFEALIVDDLGYIREGTSSNFFAVRKGVLWTADDGVLEGTARTIVIESAQKLNMPIRYEAVHSADISKCSECAISSSSRDIVPVVGIDGHAVGSGQVGPVIQELLVEYRSFVRKMVREAYSPTAA